MNKAQRKFKPSSLPILVSGTFFVVITLVAILISKSLIESETGPWTLTKVDGEEMQQITSTRTAFYSGAKDARTCPSTAADVSVFCYEGAFVAQHFVKLKEVDPRRAFFLEDYVPKIQGQDANLVRGLWLVSLGIAFAEARLNPKILVPHLRNQKLFLHVIDGWAFDSYLRRGYAFTHQLCRKELAGEALAACEFGMGRGAFFWREGIVGASRLDASLVTGFYFAKAFTSSRGVSGESLSAISRAALRLKNAWMGRATPDESSLTDCFQEHHVLECVSTEG